MVVVDIGSYGGTDFRWKQQDTEIISFDKECLLFSSFVETDFYETYSPGCSSLYLPNRAVLNRFPNIERFDVVKTTRAWTHTLDAVLDGKAVDALKLDTQGSELAILQGATRTLQHVTGVEVEVAFVPLYKHQPLFGQVDAFMRKQGFTLMDINPSYWKPLQALDRQGPGELVAADALYLRPNIRYLYAGKEIQRAYGYHNHKAATTQLHTGFGFKVWDCIRRYATNRCLDRPFASGGRLGRN